MVVINRMRWGQTVVPNAFIDRYMPAANGEYVKIYMLLLRLMDETELSVSVLADRLDMTEKDVMRGLRYWEKTGLLQLIYNDGYLSQMILRELPDDREQEITTAAVAIDMSSPKAEEQTPEAAPVQVRTRRTFDELADDEEFKELILVAGKYLERTLTRRDTELLAWMHDELQFSPELIEYLIEYCADGGHREYKYMEAVAISWHEGGIDTVAKAKEESRSFSRNRRQVLKAFGIRNRDLGSGEEKYLDKWVFDYDFPIEVIVEACTQTLANTHKPSFEYADRILSSWQEAGVATLEDLERYREERRRSRQETAAAPAKSGSNRFLNFDQRSTDYNAILSEESRNGTV